ncbi:MAG: CoA transferase [Dehalococcoidia bacterium]|nr:CoA transferase [Dehalococcoidia bacterium]
MTALPADGPLADVRVLDLATEMGVFAGRLLAELGADVIRIEPPGGDAVRERSPLLEGVAAPSGSLYHEHFNAGKRGVTLDIHSPRGGALLCRLVETADVVLETFAPGEMDALGLGFEALREVNPDLLYTTITPFGQQGPMRDYRASDLTGAASSGVMWLNGFPGDPPNQPGAEQAYHMASLVAASTTLIALLGRDRDGGGGHRIDISMQEAASMATLQHSSANSYTWLGNVPARRGLVGLNGGRSIFQCADELWISFIVPPYRWDEFLQWLRDEAAEAPGSAGSPGSPEPTLFEEPWRDPAYRIAHAEQLAAVIGALASRYERSALWHEGQRRRLLLMPVNTVADIAEDEQLRERGFLDRFEHAASGRTLTDTGVAYSLSATPAAVRRRAPQLGEHSDEVFAGLLALDEGEVEQLRIEGVL